MIGEELIQIVSNNLPQIAEVVASAFGGTVLSAIFQRGNTKTSEFEKLKAGRMDEAIGELLKNGVITYSEYYKARNFSKIAKKADKYFAEKGGTVKTGYEFDWFVRFYEAAGNISDEEMQDIWAKILAGEINQPSTYSLRMIEILRNLRKKDAELFVKACSHSVKVDSSIFLPNYGILMSECGLEYAEIMKLNEIGLMFNDASMVLRISISKDAGILAYNTEAVLVAKGDHKHSIEIKQFPLTEAGCELATVVEYENNVEDLMRLATEIKSLNNDMTVSVHRIFSYDSSKFTFGKENLLDEKCVEK